MGFHRILSLLALTALMAATSHGTQAQNPLADTDEGHGKTELILAGGQYVRMLRPDEIVGGDYHTAVFWEWNAMDHAATMGVDKSICDHIDDAKLSADRTNLAI